MSTFTNKFILDTYGGILHSDGELSDSNKSIIYDGFGNQSALTLGRKNDGATVSGNLSSNTFNVGQLTFPSLSSNVNNVLIQMEDGVVDFSDTIPSSLLEDLDPSPANTYTNIRSITINSKGLTTNVVEGDSSIPSLQAMCATTNSSNTPIFVVNSGFDSVIRVSTGRYLFTMTSGASSDHYVVNATASSDAVVNFNISCLVRRLSPTTFQVITGFEDGDLSYVDSDVMVSVIF